MASSSHSNKSGWDSYACCLLSNPKNRKEIVDHFISALSPRSFNHIIAYSDIWSILLGSTICPTMNKSFLHMDKRKVDPRSSQEIHLLQLLPCVSIPDDFRVILCCAWIDTNNFDVIFDYYDLFQWQFPEAIEGFIVMNLHGLTPQQQERLALYANIMICPNDLLNKAFASYVSSIEYPIPKETVTPGRDLTRLKSNRDGKRLETDLERRIPTENTRLSKMHDFSSLPLKRKLQSSTSISHVESNTPGEDRYCARILADDIKLFSVIDGHGGYLACDLASNFLLDKIIAKLIDHGMTSCSTDQVYEIIHDSFLEIDDMILTQTSQLVNFPTVNVMPGMTKKPMFQLAGCCAAVVVILGKNIYVAHVGDCRAVIFSKSTEEELVMTREEIYDPSYPNRFPKRQLSRNSSFSKPQLLQPPVAVAEQQVPVAVAGGISPTSVSDLPATPTGLIPPTLSRGRSERSKSGRNLIVSALEGDDDALDLGAKADNDTKKDMKSEAKSILQGGSDLSTDGTYAIDKEDVTKLNQMVSDLPLPSETVTQLLSNGGNGGSSSSSNSSDRSRSGSNNSNSNGNSPRELRRDENNLFMKFRKRGPFLSSRDPTWTDIGGDNYQYEDDGYQLSCVTTDHNCMVPEERKMVSHLSSDPNPLRPSEIGKRNYGANAPDRVAGSLAITRALGDGYLKRQDISMPAFKSYLPYITSVPTIYHRELLDSDIAVILASDGLWNHVSAKECFDVLKTAYEQSNLTTGEISKPSAMSRVKDLSTQLSEKFGNFWEERSGFLSLNSHVPSMSFDMNLYENSMENNIRQVDGTYLPIARPYPLPYNPKIGDSFENIVKSLFAMPEKSVNPFHARPIGIAMPKVDSEAAFNDNLNISDTSLRAIDMLNDEDSEDIIADEKVASSSEPWQAAAKRTRRSSGSFSSEVFQKPTKKVEISNESILQETSRLVSDKLLKACLLNASKNAGIDISSPQCDFSFKSTRWKNRRVVVDDVTVLVLPLNGHTLF